ncbi:sensor histidine kinase [Cohnella silvisoli]|uniref:histidine kinase n=1 Tax=Cohnella silvisoli TaxID=2873699 RepID=A0ABV1KT97_9BACL|nr:sensor histidine kinase [Cohnella silvisoli]MCD9021501.1 sensor histidine kinase [Cohnella silvisoli]
MKKKILILMGMAAVISLTGEFKFYPFYNNFRVSLATAAFFFCLLWNRYVHTLVFGTIIAICVPLFRIVADVIIYGQLHFAPALHAHQSAFFYYLTYSLLFHLFRIDRFGHRPLIMGLLAVVAEIAANVVELRFRSPVTLEHMTIPQINEIVLIAIFRSFSVIGLFTLVKHREQQSAERQKQQQYEQMIVLISHLYEESIQLKKTQQDAERITRDSYALYRRLKDEASLTDGERLARSALQIAGQIHEIKKDNQRIYAGISNIISSESVTEVMPVQELGDIVVKTNRKYAQMLGKTIDFRLQIEGTHPLYPVNTLLSLLNNLAANAVESIEAEGTITISAHRAGDLLLFEVHDNGPGIAPKIREALFEPGFTTKYDVSGNPSTGIGLNYVRELAESLQGEVGFRSSHNGETETTFVLRLPIDNLISKSKG